VEGFVLKSQTDTLYGTIQNNAYYDNSEFCNYKDAQGNEFKFFPEDIYGYQFIHGKHYISKTIRINGDEKLVFCEYLIKGRLDIYFFQDENLTNYYFASKDTLPLMELKFSQEIIQEDRKTYLRKLKPYQKTLGGLTYDTPQVHDKLKQLNELNHSNLIWFAKNYHYAVCDDESCIIYEKKIPLEVKLRTKVGARKLFWGGNRIRNSLYPNYYVSILFQQPLKSESIFLGIGYNWSSISDTLVDNHFINHIPISINYLNSKKGFSPIFSYDLDLKMGFGVQSLSAGVKYQWSKFAIIMDSEICYYIKAIRKPIYTSVNFGIVVNIL